MRSVAFAWLATLIMTAAAPQARADEPTRADDEMARNLFKAGKVAYEAERFEEALGFFEQAHERSGRAALLYNIGRAAERADRPERAVEAFEGYLEARPNAPQRAEVERRLNALRAQLAERAAIAERAATPASALTGEEVSEPDPDPTAPSAQEVARQNREAAEAFVEPSETGAHDDGPGLLSRWWFWTAVGVVAVGGVATAIALGSGGESQPGFEMSDVGEVAVTLQGR